MVNVHRSSEKRKGLIATAIVAVLLFSVLHLLKKQGPDTRVHTSLEDLIKTGNKTVLPLLNYYPVDGSDLNDEKLVTDLTSYIQKTVLEANGNEINPAIAKSRAEDLILASMICDVPLSFLVAKGHAEGHYATQGVAEFTNNMLNVGNTDSGRKRKFSSVELGLLCASTNIAGRIYEYFCMFPQRTAIDFEAISMNRDPHTGLGFLRHQRNYAKSNPLREEGKLSPYGAYASNPQAAAQTDGIAKKLTFIEPDDSKVEVIAPILPGIFFYEKTIRKNHKTYHSFSYITQGGESVGQLRKSLASKIHGKSHDITILPFDHSWDDTRVEDAIVPSSSMFLIFLYIGSTQ